MADKITVYYEKDFKGHMAQLPVGNYTQAELKKHGIENNKISSVKVPVGLKVILYKDDNFHGEQMPLVANAEELGAMHNNTSSIKVVTWDSRRANFYKKKDFQGEDVSLPPGEYTQAELERYGIDNNTISSVKVPGGLKVVLFKNDHFKGDQLPLNADTKELGAMHNNASSIKIS
jgi:hypothetical protein